MAVKIEKEVLADGKTIRWRARGVSTGKDPVTGRRTQRTISGKTRKEVEAEVRRIGAAVDRGTYIKPWEARSASWSAATWPTALTGGRPTPGCHTPTRSCQPRAARHPQGAEHRPPGHRGD